MKPYVIQSLTASLTSPRTTLPSLQRSSHTGLLEHGGGSLGLGTFIVAIPSASSCAPHLSMAGAFPSSLYVLLRKFLEYKIYIAAMRMLLDVQLTSMIDSAIALWSSLLSLHQSQPSPSQ